MRELCYLEMLEIRDCKLSEIDLATFCDYSSLITLNLQRNMIRYVVNTSTRKCRVYDTLYKLQLQSNMITALNIELFNIFINLKVLNLHNNSISSLSGRMSQNTLETLSLSKNKLEHVDLCGWYVPSMDRVSFASNLLTKVPECINILTRVSMLFLNDNKITNFNIGSIAGLNNLTWLDLQCNQLTEVMLNSAHFPSNLELLDIQRNNLTSLDMSFIPVRSLVVNVDYNLISSVNVSRSSPNISKLLMWGNPIDCSWSTRLEQLYGECYRNDSFFLLHDVNVRMCIDYQSYLIWNWTEIWSLLQ